MKRSSIRRRDEDDESERKSKRRRFQHKQKKKEKKREHRQQGVRKVKDQRALDAEEEAELEEFRKSVQGPPSISTVVLSHVAMHTEVISRPRQECSI